MKTFIARFCWGHSCKGVSTYHIVQVLRVKIWHIVAELCLAQNFGHITRNIIIKFTILGGWVVMWVKSVVILVISQLRWAGFRVRAELSNMVFGVK